MPSVNQKDESKQKLKELLRELFQFDATELDFGIYRIMNYKRQEINNFIENDLIRAVEREFEKYKSVAQKELEEELQKAKRELISSLGEPALKPDGEVKDEFQTTPAAQNYLKAKKQLEEANVTENIQSQVFNDCYSFFSRYYEDGDFIPKRRYSSRQHKYAIPYSGEEVKLYWANFDQYYVKMGEVFKDYEFSSRGWNFIFTTTFADVEASNIKGGSRYFFLTSDRPININNQDKACLIKFEYRPLCDDDLKQYPVKTKEGKEKTVGIKQDELNQILHDKILGSISDPEPKLILAEIQEEKTTLEKHLYKYTRKITSDFFIHKSLKGFLQSELDYFIKAEVLDLNDLEQRHVTRAKVVENIGKRIIEFLSQIEEFQKMLWEKKKFVLKTNYVITLDRIPEEFHQEILNNKQQLKEWKDLGIDLSTVSSLRGTKSQSNLKLPVDTKYFSDIFKERLLERLSEQGDLDDLLDGVLIKSENWQALNMLLRKYKGKVQCIYIDPPFNTGTNEFLYKNKYLDSSWITMMYDRLDFGRKLLRDDGSIYVRIDYHGNYYVRSLMDIIFGEENFRNEILVNRTQKAFEGANRLITANDSSFLYSKCDRFSLNPIKKRREGQKWIPMHSPGIRWTKVSREYLAFYDSAQLIKKHGECYSQGRVFNSKVYMPPNGRHWTFTQERLERYAQEERIRENPKAGILEYQTSLEANLDSNWLDIPGYVVPPRWSFPTENSEVLLQRVIEASSNKGDLVLDYFLGSGTTTAIAHKLGRKWIGVEMGEFFEDIPLKRLKKVLYGEQSGISKDIKWRGGGFFKYQYLEQYEDTLHNMEFPNEGRAQQMLKLFGEEETSEYLMKYMLRFETEGSPSLLDLKQFENPFDYTLRIVSNGKGEKITNIDLVETFNYLIGLKVSRYKFLEENRRGYVFILGERNNRRAVIVWRPTKDINLERDKEVIEGNMRDFKPDEIFVNGDSLVKGYKPIESEFKALMAAR